MKKFHLLILVLLSFVLLTPVVQAQGVDLAITGIPVIDQALVAFGLGAVLTPIVEILKRLGLLPDGTAGKVHAVLGILLYALVLAADIFSMDLAGETAQLIIVGLTQAANMALTIISGITTFGILRKGQIFNPTPLTRPA